MNVVVVADYLYPDAVGGSWNYAHDLAQRLAARGHRCFGVGAHPGDGRPFRERVGAVEYYRYPLSRGNHALSFASRLVGSMRCFREIASRHPIDLLHTHTPMGAVGACLAARAGGIRQVATMHGTGILDEYRCEGQVTRGKKAPPFYGTAIDRVERWHLRQARRLLAHSRFSRDAFVSQHGLDPESVTILPPGIDLERFRPGPREVARRDLGLPIERPILLSVRRITPRMGLDRLIRATRQVVARFPDLLLLIGGQGPSRPGLEALVEELRLTENVRFAGFIPDASLPLYYQAADLFCIPSTASEGFGLVSLEALACDLPALGTPVGGTVEVLGAIDPELLFPDMSAEAMAPHLLTWLTRVRAGDAGTARSYHAKVAERFHWDRCTDGIEAVFNEVRSGNVTA